MFNGTQAVDIQIAKKFVQSQQLKGLKKARGLLNN